MPIGTNRSAISGEVSDSQGAVIPGAEVKIVHQTQGTTRTTHTNASGYYNAPFLDPGAYRIYVQAKDFSMAASDSITLSVGQGLVFSVRLKLGSAPQTVNVNGGESITRNTATSSLRLCPNGLRTTQGNRAQHRQVIRNASGYRAPAFAQKQMTVW